MKRYDTYTETDLWVQEPFRVAHAVRHMSERKVRIVIRQV